MDGVRIITRPACGHGAVQQDCVKCLAHHLDVTRHAEAMLRKHLKTRVGVTIHVIGARRNARK